MKKTISYILKLVASDKQFKPLKDNNQILAHILCAKMTIYGFMGERFTEISLDKGKIVNDRFICDEYDIHDETLINAMLFATEIIAEILYSKKMDLSDIEARLTTYFEDKVHFFYKTEHFENFMQSLFGIVFDSINKESKEISSYAEILLDEKRISGDEYFEGDLIEKYVDAKWCNSVFE